MSNIQNIGNRVAEVSSGEAWDAITGITLNTASRTYTAGDGTGRMFEIECPFGTQAMANNLLASFSGFEYHPLEATDAIMRPDFEIGDGIAIGGLYSGVFSAIIKASPLYTVDVTAPESEDIDHEYPFADEAKTVSAKNVKHGGSHGSYSGGGITSGTITPTQANTTINNSLADADFSADVFSGAATADYVKGKNVYVTTNEAFFYNGTRVIPVSATFKMGDGTSRQLTLLGFA